MTTRTRDPDLTPAQLIEIMRGGAPDQGVGKMRALAAIQLRPTRQTGNLLMEILADKEEPPRFRHMAAAGLYRLGGTAARNLLVTAAERADADTAGPIAMGLGRVGSLDDMAVIERLEKIAPAHARNRARFAATLLAYRFGVEGHDVTSLAARDLQSLNAARAQPIAFRPAPADEAGLALRALETDPLDVGVALDNAAHIECRPNTFVWLWAKEARANQPAAFRNAKAVAGILLVRSPVEETYSLALVGLATPGRSGSLLTLHRPQTGHVLYEGNIGTDGQFTLKARAWPGLAAVEISGRVADGKIEAAVALSATVVTKAMTPKQATAER